MNEKTGLTFTLHGVKSVEKNSKIIFWELELVKWWQANHFIKV